MKSKLLVTKQKVDRSFDVAVDDSLIDKKNRVEDDKTSRLLSTTEMIFLLERKPFCCRFFPKICYR